MTDDLKNIGEPRGNALATAAVYLIGLTFGLAIATGIAHYRKPAATVTYAPCGMCHGNKTNNKAAMVKYFKDSGSKSPEKMAAAVLATQSPRLLAAIAKVETGGNPHIRKGGYKGRHAGAFQVNSRIHGRVSHDPIKQAKQAEAILTELTETMPIRKALSVYGGDSSSRYQRTVLAELVRVP